MSSSCSIAWFLAEPVAVEADAGRDASRRDRSRCWGRLSPMKGHGPWLAGSSCAQTISASGYVARAARISSTGSG